MRYRAGPAALPQGRMNAAVGRVLAYQAVEQANRMQQATRDPASQGLPGRRREHPARLPAQLPIALDSGRAVFVYVDPGHDTATALRSWGAAHRGLWHALGKPRPVRRGRRRRAHLAGARASPTPGSARNWPGSSGRSLQGAVQILEEFGGLQATMKRSVVLEKQVRRQPGPGSIRRASTWRTVRLAGARYR